MCFIISEARACVKGIEFYTLANSNSGAVEKFFIWIVSHAFLSFVKRRFFFFFFFFLVSGAAKMHSIAICAYIQKIPGHVQYIAYNLEKLEN